jgi:LysM repeat protein
MILLLTALVWVSGAQAVSEERIGASAAHVRVAPVPSDQSNQTGDSSLQSAAAADSLSQAPLAPRSPSQPRATFPYTIRPGDTLGLIASEFGLSVAELTRANHISDTSELTVGNTLRIPNPWLAREREAASQIDQLSRQLQEATNRAQTAQAQMQAAQDESRALTSTNQQMTHDVRLLAWWRGAGYLMAAITLVAVGAMLLLLIEWWMLRNRFRAVAEMNESLRRLDYKYRGALAKAELRLQELYGRRRRGLREGQERPKLAEEVEIEALSQQLKSVLEQHLERLGRAGVGAKRARSRERVGGIGSPVEIRSVRR